MKLLVEIFGWYGAVAILLAYTLVSFDFLAASSIWYQLLNGTGAIGIVVVSLYKKAYQPAALNIMWAAIALVAIFNIFR